MNTSEKIKAYRLKNAWSQEQLAQLASLSVRTVQRIEKGHTPGLETISALASVFNVTVSELSDEAELANGALDTRILDARRRVQEEARFYRTLTIAFLICAALMAVNYFYSPGSDWSLIVTLIWGSLIAIRALRTFVFRERIAQWQHNRMLRLLREKNISLSRENTSADKDH